MDDQHPQDPSLRKCIATGDILPKAQLLRFVIGPDGDVVPDLLGKLPGRGIWVKADAAALKTAVSKKLFSRAAKAQVKVDPDLPERLERQLADRVGNLLALARKSGAAVAGYEKVKDWLAKEEAWVLLQASDGSERGKSKLSTPYKGVFIGWLTADELGMAFGRESVIHAALSTGGLAKRVVDEAAKLKGLRGYVGAEKRRKG
jgi:predicted RNA-binding protein YlxR (DUF448 family)